jgi:hypothetical protein
MTRTFKIAVIYKITNRCTGVVVYVGQAMDHMQRWTNEADALSRGTFHNKKLQAEFDVWGSVFVWSALERRDGKRVSGDDLEQWLCDRERHWKSVLCPTCNAAEPPKAIRRVHPRFNPLLQEMWRQFRQKRRSTH